jgi:hypothetical protein
MLSPLWKEFMINEATVWTDFHNYWLAQSEILPIYFVRYEDLLVNEEVMFTLSTKAFHINFFDLYSIGQIKCCSSLQRERIQQD